MTTATLRSAVVLPRARWYRNSVVAVLAGLFANAILSSATDMILVAAGVFPPYTSSAIPPSSVIRCYCWLCCIEPRSASSVAISRPAWRLGGP